MKAISGKDFAKLLQKKGWHLKNIKGSHHVFTKTGNSARISVPVHKNQSLKKGLLRHLMKIGDIKEEDL